MATIRGGCRGDCAGAGGGERGLLLESIGLEPLGTQVYESANGTEFTFDFAVAEIEIIGRMVGATVVVGEPRADPLVGATVLGSARVQVDPFNGELKRLPPSRL